MTFSVLSSLACESSQQQENKPIECSLSGVLSHRILFVVVGQPGATRMQTLVFKIKLLILSFSLTLLHAPHPYRHTVAVACDITVTLIDPFVDTNPSGMAVFGILIADFGEDMTIRVSPFGIDHHMYTLMCVFERTLARIGTNPLLSPIPATTYAHYYEPVMPTTYASWMILLIRFSNDSLTNSKKHNKNGLTASTSLATEGQASVTPHPELYTCDTILALPDDEEKQPIATKNSRARRGGLVVALAAEKNIVSIAAVSNIVNMILQPMVIVPFLDYATLGKIPRSNTAKPSTSDGAFAKMGSLKSISQPLTNGWTVIFVSVSSTSYLYPTTLRVGL
jgi:hypothetical protein